MSKDPTSAATPPPASPISSPVERTAMGRMYNWASLFHLAGLAELKRFPSRAHRDNAMRQIALGRIGGIGGFITRPLVLVLLSLLMLVALFQWSPSGKFAGSRQNAYLFDTCIAVVIMLVLFYWVHRPLCARYLRRYLAGIGVAICCECGYDLTRVVKSANVCPECGTAFGG